MVCHNPEQAVRTASAATSSCAGPALPLIRVVENAIGHTWRNTRHELDRMHLVTLATGHGEVAQRSATTPAQRDILRALHPPEPPRFFDFTLTRPGD